MGNGFGERAWGFQMRFGIRRSGSNWLDVESVSCSASIPRALMVRCERLLALDLDLYMMLKEEVENGDTYFRLF